MGELMETDLQECLLETDETEKALSDRINSAREGVLVGGDTIPGVQGLLCLGIFLLLGS